MNKEVLTTILGVAGLSLLKKVSGSSNEPIDLPDELGFLWFEVTISDKVPDFSIEHFVELLEKIKKYADERKGMDADEIFRYHGAEYDEDGYILFPDGVDGEIALVLRYFYEYAATAIMGVYGQGNFHNERMLERFISDGSCIERIKPIRPNKIFIQINILNIIKNGYRGSIDSILLGVKELINNFINIDVLTQIVEEKGVYYEEDRDEDWGSIINPVVNVDYDELPARFSVSLVKPKDPMVLNAVCRGNSELRKF